MARERLFVVSPNLQTFSRRFNLRLVYVAANRRSGEASASSRSLSDLSVRACVRINMSMFAREEIKPSMVVGFQYH
jgi:hypothetical protein